MKKLACSEELEAILQKCDMPAYPDAVKKAGVGYTDYLCRAHKQHFNTDKKTGEEYVYTPNRNRQCSIGWHTECSLDGCGCVCHELMKLIKASIEADK